MWIKYWLLWNYIAGEGPFSYSNGSLSPDCWFGTSVASFTGWEQQHSGPPSLYWWKLYCIAGSSWSFSRTSHAGSSTVVSSVCRDVCSACKGDDFLGSFHLTQKFIAVLLNITWSSYPTFVYPVHKASFFHCVLQENKTWKKITCLSGGLSSAVCICESIGPLLKEQQINFFKKTTHGG